MAAPGRPATPWPWPEYWACTGECRGRLVEGVTAIEQSLAAAPPDPSPGQALALAKLSLLSFRLGDFARTQSAATSALQMGAAIGDTRSQALALGPLGALVSLSDPAAGDPMLMRAAELARTAGDDVALCDALTSLAISHFFRDDPAAMRGPLGSAQGGGSYRLRGRHPLVPVVPGPYRFLGRGPDRCPRLW
jgi:hypothetical protein